MGGERPTACATELPRIVVNEKLKGHYYSYHRNEKFHTPLKKPSRNREYVYPRLKTAVLENVTFNVSCCKFIANPKTFSDIAHHEFITIITIHIAAVILSSFKTVLIYVSSV